VSIDLLETAAAALGPLRDRVVFLGGATTVLWMTDPASRAPRVTYDVDVVAEVVTLASYETFQEQLRSLDFSEDIESGVICRWRHKETDLILDAVPAEPRLAGFGGRWLQPAVEAAVSYQLPSRTTIRVVPPAYLVVTKLEAFADRGNDDCLGSRDFEDVILLVDSREELAK
jgi:predicted nucleotidyltransferase